MLTTHKGNVNRILLDHSGNCTVTGNGKCSGDVAFWCFVRCILESSEQSVAQIKEDMSESPGPVVGYIDQIVYSEIDNSADISVTNGATSGWALKFDPKHIKNPFKSDHILQCIEEARVQKHCVGFEFVTDPELGLSSPMYISDVRRVRRG